MSPLEVLPVGSGYNHWIPWNMVKCARLVMKLPGFIALNPTAFRPEAADTRHREPFSAECPFVS